MSEYVTWFDFDSPEAQGRIGVKPCSWDLEIYLGDEDHRIALVDLYYFTEIAKGIRDLPPHAVLHIDEVINTKPVAYVRYLPEGTRVFFSRDMHFHPDYKGCGSAYGRFINTASKDAS
ncbi:MAG TPA: hypothetical protein VGK87_12130 [Anaerolineae bacterium]